MRAERAEGPGGYEAVVVGGALYALRWDRDARRFVTRNVRQLRTAPVWLFRAVRSTTPPLREPSKLA